MRDGLKPAWENLIVDPGQVMKKLEPGMSIFLGTGVGEPRTLVKHLMSADSAHLKDLEELLALTYFLIVNGLIFAEI